MIPNRRPLLETLEERILYSADPGPASLAVAVMESSLDLQDGNSCEALTTELVFVDSRSPDYQMLLDDFAAQQAAGRRLEVVMVDASEDGIGLIGRSLEGRSDVSAIHIVGHGEAGSAQLGASRLDSQTLLQRAGEIAAWRDALTADADLLLYGCAVGDGAVGRDLINGLAELTGADVAASDDPTGSAELGGDWQLEVQHGQIEVASLTSDSLQARWRGLLNTYTVTNTADSGAGSLRQAILNANANSGADIINFAITGTQVHTITLNSILPNLTDKVTIDATTDDSFAANGSKPAIILNGNNYTGDGLVITASAGGTTIRGLVIQRFVGDGIQIDSASQGNTIAGNYIGSIGTNGLLSTGTGMVNYAGVRVLGANNVIGGITAADRNVISGNQHGIVISGAGASGNQVVGNYIGTDATGNAKVPNFVDGIHIEAGATGNTVGGSSSAQRNVISGNWQDGVEVADEASDGNIVRGNWIGVAANGSQVLANDGDGVMISGGADNTIVGGSGANDGNWIAGGWKVGVEIDGATTGTLIQNNRIGTDLAGTANWGVWETGVLIENSAGTTSPSNNSVLDNIIAFSGQGGGTYSSGIALADTAGTGNALMRNIIYSSVGLGIDLRADNAVLANDYLDPDTGPNGLQNYPVLFAPTTTGSSIKINGDISTLPSTNYRIEFFASPSADTSGYGEASAYLGSVNVTTNSTGYAIFVTNLAVNVPVGYYVTATATKANADFSAFSDTSEFALSALVQAAVNTAPTITQGATTGMGAIYSEDSPTLGFMVDGVVQVVGWADPDAGAVRGMALTGTTGNGTWQYSTDQLTWRNVGTVSGSNALLLSSTSWLRYVGDGANGETPTIAFRAWDMTTGTASTNSTPSYVTPGAGGGSTAFSTQTANAFTVIDSVNDAPVLVPSAPVLTSITEDQTSNGGQTVASIVGSSVSDVDLGALKGIAVLATANGNGFWEYSTDGTTWNAVGPVSEGSALLLRAEDRIRFVPDGKNGTTASITYRAWDQSSGTPGSKADAGTYGGTSAFSVATDTASLAVTDVNDVPVITSSATASVAENTTAVLTVTATDVDLPAQTLSYSINGGADASKFQINSSTGALSFITAPDFDAPTDVGGNNVYNVTVQVSDGVGGTTSQAITVTVTPVNDNLPVITSSATASVAENTTAVLTVTATDADLPAQTLSYSISGGADASKFQINLSTGALSFITAPDFEAPTDVGGNNVYNVTVQVSDGAGGTASQAITVTVTPVNDNLPVITSSATASVPENTTAVLTVTATDADLPAQTLSYSISGGADASKFQINSSTGALSFITAPDFDAPTDVGGNNVYNVTVQVSDGAGGTTSQAITVTVTPVNDNLPVITSSATASVAENSTAVLTVTATDADLPAQTLSYSIIGGADAAKFQIDANTGALSFITAPDFEAPTDAGGDNVYNV
ncbi:MAG: DUF4347 domain-containing protein, partial [Zoogloea sp.]|nr:DUF4347 domain-containing protein [Zoogloea sp.]